MHWLDAGIVVGLFLTAAWFGGAAFPCRPNKRVVWSLYVATAAWWTVMTLIWGLA